LLLFFFVIVIVIVIVVKSGAAGGVSGGCEGTENMGPTALSVDASRDAFDPVVISGPTPTVDT